MRRPVPALLVVLTVVGSPAILGVPAQAVSRTSGTIRYASPSGDASAACTKAQPCDIGTAVEGAGAGDTVVLEPGVYGSTSQPLTESIQSQDAITIEGESAVDRPVVITSAGIDVPAATIDRITEIYSGSRDAVTANAASQIAVAAGSGALFACGVRDLDESLCIDSASGGTASFAEFISGTAESSEMVFDDDTFIETAQDGVGVLAAAGGSASLTVDLTNCIVEGRQDDLYADPTASGATAKINLAYSDAPTHAFNSTSGGSGGVSYLAHDVHAAPTFVKPADDDYAERPASPTVDAGTPTVLSKHATDLLGNPRVIGDGPDIGAFELLEKPLIYSVNLVKPTRTSLTFKVVVDDEAVPTLVKVAGTSGKHKHMRKLLDLKPKNSPHTVKLTLSRLKPKTTYLVEATVKNAAGHTESSAVDYTTT